MNLVKFSKRIILEESKAVKRQLISINKSFFKAVDLISNLTGKMVVLGIGKSGLIGRKIAATFSSIGIPSIFLHPVEVAHGDMGVILPQDITLIVSYSGETEEIKRVLPLIKEKTYKIISLTGRRNSWLARNSDVVIPINIKKEACPYGLIPTSSAVATLALGDALALSVGLKIGFKKEDLLKHHPAGTISKKLNLKVKDLMRVGKDNPVADENLTVKEALIVMTKTKLGATSVIDKKRKLVGYFTDGDLRRYLQKDPNILKRRLYEVMTKDPKVIHPDAFAIEAARMMQKHKCDNLPVVDKNYKPIGIIDERDLIAAGLI